MADRRKGRTIRMADGLAAVVKAADVSGSAMLSAKAADVWAEVVGEEIARHTAGVLLRDGELTVHVDSHAWAAELTALSETLRDRLGAVLGKDQVRSLRFTVSRKVEDERSKRKAQEEARRGYGGERVAPYALSEAERARVEESAAAIRSEALREAAVRAAVRDLEWKKARRTRKTTQAPDGDATGGKTGLLP